jgi:hypothetical protein
METDVRTACEAWIVLITTERLPCGHRMSNMVAICVSQGSVSGEELARKMCQDCTYLIGPVPVNALLPGAAMSEWPGSYRPIPPPAEETVPESSSSPQTPEEG